MQIEQKPTFRRAYRKLHLNQRAAVDNAVRVIIESPDLGEVIKGDLSGVSVYKFDCVNQQYLLAYEWEEGSRLLIALGPHENFYRDLKR
ncbi:MAG: mRNA interferase RelE/StbE [Gammaproteobacteria bacterium]|jgi:mRNA interferase RelE/StbE